MCTSASKKKPSSRRPCVCKKRCMRVKRVAGDAGDCGGLSAERDPGEANFLTRKSLKTGVKNFKLLSLYWSPAIPCKFSVRARGVGPKSPAVPRDPRKLVSQHCFSITDVAGDPRTTTEHIFPGRTPPNDWPTVFAPAARFHHQEPVGTCTQKGKTQTWRFTHRRQHRATRGEGNRHDYDRRRLTERTAPAGRR
jgi:hypothetical protein